MSSPLDQIMRAALAEQRRRHLLATAQHARLAAQVRRGRGTIASQVLLAAAGDMAATVKTTTGAKGAALVRPRLESLAEA